MGGFAVQPEDVNHQPALYRILNSKEVQKILETDPSLFSHFPDISEEHIVARSQSDSLSKVIALVQIFSFCMTCILRKAQGLSLSILEISTVAYAICAILTYIFWWKKPRIKAEPTMVNWMAVHTAERIKSETEAGDPGSVPERQLFRRMFRQMLKRAKSVLQSRYWTVFSFMAIVLISSTFYGLLHLFAWDASFPTTIEGILWRISILVVTASLIPLFMIYLVLFKNRSESHQPETQITAKYIPCLVFLVIYILARLVMLVEAFRQLLHLPPDGYKVASWSNYLPQFA